MITKFDRIFAIAVAVLVLIIGFFELYDDDVTKVVFVCTALILFSLSVCIGGLRDIQQKLVSEKIAEKNYLEEYRLLDRCRVIRRKGEIFWVCGDCNAEYKYGLYDGKKIENCNCGVKSGPGRNFVW